MHPRVSIWGRGCKETFPASCLYPREPLVPFPTEAVSSARIRRGRTKSSGNFHVLGIKLRKEEIKWMLKGLQFWSENQLCASLMVKHQVQPTESGHGGVPSWRFSGRGVIALWRQCQRGSETVLFWVISWLLCSPPLPPQHNLSPWVILTFKDCRGKFQHQISFKDKWRFHEFMMPGKPSLKNWWGKAG